MRTVKLTLDRPVILGVGAALIAFGGFFFGISALIVQTVYGTDWNPAVFLVLIVIASVVTTVGIGLFVFGAAKPAKPPG
ncbi:MAG: hypothetical protein HY296_04765 [Thaumarchaeota archaeon]|nr:hypothetical protein [Nitrososphaerota archaeon]